MTSMATDLAEVLAQSPPFDSLDERTRADLVASADVRRYAPDELVLESLIFADEAELRWLDYVEERLARG